MNQLSSATRVLLVATEQESNFGSVAREAQQIAFPEGKTISVTDAAQALKTPFDSGARILVLSRPDRASLDAAIAADDAAGLPRWAIVVCSETSDADNAAVDIVAPSDWQPRLVAQVFRGAAMRHELMQENVAFRGDLLAIGTRVVHDLRSPLGGVLTTAEVLKEVLLTDAPQHASLTHSLVDSVEGQMKLIRQLSLVAKAAAQTHLLEKFSMSLPFWSAWQQVEKHAQAMGATVTQPPSWPDVIGSAALSEGVWQHLLANALAHSGTKPRIVIGWDKAGAEIRFWVQSNQTIPAEKRAVLFTPFHSLHRPNAPRGWGLPIVRQLVDLQGGRCGYDAPSEGGSIFYFTLPAAQSP